MLRPLHIIMPMAGEGSRFLKEGITTPKPLIEFEGLRLFERAIGCLQTLGAPLRCSFIVRQEHIDKHHIDVEIRKSFPEADIRSVVKTTRGAVETCLLAEEALQDDEAVVIIDCDLEYKSKDYLTEITKILSQPVDKVNGGVLLSFQADSPRYSYALTNEKNEVIRTAEKEVISHNALCGSYFFSSKECFLYAAHALMNQQNFDKPEYYVSLLYNYLLRRGDTIRLTKVDEYHSYGTPEELQHEKDLIDNRL